MPYIKQEDRDRINFGDDALMMNEINSAGEIQYAVARIIQSYMERNKLNYQLCNDVMGALAGAQMEFNRRVVVPYEDLKIQDNGDV